MKFNTSGEIEWEELYGSGQYYYLSANDLDGDPISFAGLGLPHGAAVTGSQFEWTPDSHAPEHS